MELLLPSGASKGKRGIIYKYINIYINIFFFTKCNRLSWNSVAFQPQCIFLKQCSSAELHNVGGGKSDHVKWIISLPKTFSALKELTIQLTREEE